jgi:hypothetical protein
MHASHYANWAGQLSHVHSEVSYVVTRLPAFKFPISTVNILLSISFITFALHKNQRCKTAILVSEVISDQIKTLTCHSVMGMPVREMRKLDTKRAVSAVRTAEETIRLCLSRSCPAPSPGMLQALLLIRAAVSPENTATRVRGSTEITTRSVAGTRPKS